MNRPTGGPPHDPPHPGMNPGKTEAAGKTPAQAGSVQGARAQAGATQAGSPQGAKAGETARAAAPPVSRALQNWTRVRENAEAVLVAIILALVIRHFSLEAFEIPTGSMAPGLRGVHIETTCPNCATTAAVGISTDSLTGKVVAGRMHEGAIYEGPCSECEIHFTGKVLEVGDEVTCPRCNELHPAGDPHGYRPSEAVTSIDVSCRECGLAYKAVYEAGDWRSGHKILVNKSIYKWRDPVRWEVIVFKFNRQRNYIKRLVGLPGERILIEGGDVLIDDVIERKPVWAQDSLWFPVHDSDISELWAPEDVQAWRYGIGWKQPSAGGFTVVADAEPTSLTYARSIKNHYPYNGSRQTTPLASARNVRDLRIVADIEVGSGSGDVSFVVVNHKQEFLARLPVTEGVAVLAVRNVDEHHQLQEQELLRLPGVRLLPGTARQVEFWVADRQLVLRIDGEILAKVPLPEQQIRAYISTYENTVRIDARDVRARLPRVQVFRDIHYTSPGTNPKLKYAIRESFQIGRERFFALGDNSPSSLDSRAWGDMDRDNLLGRAFGVFWPALPWRWQVKWIR